MPPTVPRLLAVAALLSLIPIAGMAEVYKWIDEDGVTHYSQQPPPEGTPTVITPDAAPPTDAAEGRGDDGGNQDEGAEDEEEDDGGGPDTIAEFCEDLRERKEILQSGRPIRIKAEDGTLTNLDEEGRAQQLERVQGQLQDHCQGQDAAGGDGA